MDWSLVLREFGLGGLFGIAMVLLLFLIVRWVLNVVDKLIHQYNEDRERWLVSATEERQNWIKAYDRQIVALNEHTAQAKIFHEMVCEAHKCQRQEHQEMIHALGRINGYKT